MRADKDWSDVRAETYPIKELCIIENYVSNE